MVRLIVPENWSHSHIWNRKPKQIDNGQVSNLNTQRGHTQYELDPETCTVIHPKVAGRFLTIQLDDGDYLQRNPELLRHGLSAALMQGPDVRIILACKFEYEIEGQTITNFVQGLSIVLQGVSLDTDESRVRISHTA